MVFMRKILFFFFGAWTRECNKASFNSSVLSYERLFFPKGCAFHQVGVQCKFSTCRKKGSASVHYFVKQTITPIFMFIV